MFCYACLYAYDYNISINLQQGKRNMYRKGQILRKQYNGFLSEFYIESEILTQTTNIERTYMSAAMVLAGLYPPKDYQKWSDTETVWQPIRIHENSPDHGLVCIYLLVPTCMENRGQKFYYLHRIFYLLIVSFIKLLFYNSNNRMSSALFRNHFKLS